MRKRKADIVPITATTLTKAGKGKQINDVIDATAVPTPPPVSASPSQSLGAAAASSPAPLATLPPASSHARSALLVRYFSYLDAVVYSLQRRSSEGIWSLVQRGIDQMMSSGRSNSSSSGSSFTLEDLSLIVSIFPSAFVVEWKYVAVDSLAPQQYHLCISINTNTVANTTAASDDDPKPPSSYHSGAAIVLFTRDMKAEARTETFRSLMVDYIAKHRAANFDASDNGFASNTPLPIRSDAIPVKPNAATVMSLSKRATATAHKFTQIVQEKLLKSSQELLSQSSQGVDGMEQLRLLAAERGKKQVEQTHECATIKAQNEREILLRSLPAVTDSLRSIVRMKSRMSHPLQDILSSLAPQLRLTKQALLARLVLLTEVAPEFLSVFPANDIVPVATLRVNMDSPYGAIRSKLLALQRCDKS